LVINQNDKLVMNEEGLKGIKEKRRRRRRGLV
jgi:hypothetical protein